jgi:hypothetical protein
MSFRVIAPLVVVRDRSGRLQHTYHGAVVPWLGDEQKEHFLRHKLVEEVAAAPAVTPQPAPAAAPGDKAPLKTAPDTDWVKYAVSKGANQDDAQKATKQELIELYGS